MDARSSTTTGLGIIVKDFMGEIHVSSCCNRQYKHQPAIVEVMALKSAMLIFKDLGLTEVAFEGNCKTVVSAANSSDGVIDLEIYPLFFF